MSIEFATLLMFVSMMVLLASGLPVAFVLGGISLLFGFALWGPESINVVAIAASDLLRANLLVAVPLFVFMAFMLEKSGIAEDLYGVMHSWMGGLKGGLAAGTVIACTIVAAMSGISTTGVLMMGIIGLPAMQRRNYDTQLSMGCIMAGGALGPLIPPSVVLIVYSLLSGQSIGKLFLGGIFPGLLLAFVFIVYILVRCFLNPDLGPALPIEERASWKEKFFALRGILLPVLIVSGVLGSLFFGIATPTEAASVGALGAIISAAIYRRLNGKILKDVAFDSLKTVSMVMWVIFGAGCFATVYQGIGASELIQNIIKSWPVSKWVILCLIQAVWIVLGCLMDAISILMVTAPLFIPVANFLGIDLLWLGLLYAVNTEMAYLTPPFGINLFVMRGITQGKGITTREIYKAAIPFVCLQLLVLVLVMVFPEIITWLPGVLSN
ncbi:MAG: TRAP dicarboxylate transporter subunit DctM [Desulfobacterales bacterium RIFOXYA12_FULL_46_15]|nr:MAG: TRAP dicarboxylate transporter subunit DctM [Desulfobacterales bacterium RIFOXYA12_FULL_46_15]